jgi:hypothetical protein
MKNSNIYLTIDKNVLEKHAKNFLQEGKINEIPNEYLITPYPDDEQKESMAEINLIDEGLNFDFDRETLTINSEIRLIGTDEKLSYLSITIPMDIDTMSQIVNAYVKKLNKLKTVLEATK